MTNESLPEFKTTVLVTGSKLFELSKLRPLIAEFTSFLKLAKLTPKYPINIIETNSAPIKPPMKPANKYPFKDFFFFIVLGISKLIGL